MSTNIDPSHVPDTGALEQVLNQLFTAAPGSIPGAIGHALASSQLSKDPLLKQGNVHDLGNPQTSHYDPHFSGNSKIPKSVAGSGVSPSAYSPEHVYEAKDVSSVPKSHLHEHGHTPASVAGSGLSPLAGLPYTGALPPTNDQGFGSYNRSPFQEPVSKDIGAPSALGNSIYSKDAYLEQGTAKPGPTAPVPLQLEHGVYVPFSSFHYPHEQEKPFETQLQDALKNVAISTPQAQLPSTLAEVPSHYYFLSDEAQLPLRNEEVGKATKGLGLSSLLSPPFDVNVIRNDFPILKETVNGRPLIWLDNAATTQKPKQVIERISYFYEHENSNIHRAAHEMAARSTDAYEGAREKVKSFLNARSSQEIIFVRGATEGINLVAKSWGEQYLQAGDEIIVSHLEHHANIVPWQQLATKKGVKVKVIPVDDDGQLLLEEYARLLSPKTKLVAFTQVSNALGTITPAKQIIHMAHQAGAKVLVDGAQSVSHMRVDVQELDCDWLVFSGHKIFAPTGIGVVYGKEALLNDTQPWQGGGNMIKDVTFEHTQYHDAPGRFEAGTGNIADAVGLGAAIDYVSRIGMDLIGQYEHYLLVYATRLLKEVPGLRLVGTAQEKASVLSFVLKGYTNDEVGQILNKEGIAVRTGHHCAQPILRRFGLESTVRPSLAFYNTCQEVDTLVAILHRLGSHKKKT